MAGLLDNLRAGLTRFHDAALDGARDGMRDVAPDLRADLQATKAHGDVTGATRASYGVRVLGRGETGAAAFADEVAAAAALNPDEVATASVTITTDLGAVWDDKMAYAEDRETARAGEKATLGPSTAPFGSALTAAAARGSRRALGGG